MRRVVLGSLRHIRSAATAAAAGLGENRCLPTARASHVVDAICNARNRSLLPFNHLAFSASAQPASLNNSAPEAAQGEAGAPHGRHHHSAPTPAETGGPLAKYEHGLKSGLYRPDPRQQLTMRMLQDLYEDLQRAGASQNLPGQHHHRPRRRPSGLTMVDHVGGGDEGPSVSGRDASSSGGSGGGAFSWFTNLLGGGNGGDAIGRDAPAVQSGPAVRGLYMYGGVGCGKTMMMDLFVSTAPAHFKVLRTHFHDFMLEVHASLRRHASAPDPLLTVADGISGRARVLALDELFVTDVADAMILNRLFGRLWDRGLVLVATSNRPPDDLYKGGLQRNLFMPFIHRLKDRCVPHDMESSTDYRRLAQHQRGLYFVQPPGSASSSASAPSEPDALEERFLELANGATPGPARVDVMMGRSLDVPRAAGKACMFDFQDLCGRPVAAADYLALTGAFHTLALRGVPVFGAASRTEAYRFVTLIDVMYEARTRLLVTAEAHPVDLFTNILTQFDAAKRPDLAAKPEAVVDDNLGFSKDRTISRLTEMQSLEYLLHHARQHEPSLVLALQEAHAKSREAAAAAGH